MMMVNDEFERTQKEEVVVDFKVLSNPLGRLEQTKEIQQIHCRASNRASFKRFNFVLRERSILASFNQALSAA
jgi:hypothetical protein